MKSAKEVAKLWKISGKKVKVRIRSDLPHLLSSWACRYVENAKCDFVLPTIKAPGPSPAEVVCTRPRVKVSYCLKFKTNTPIVQRYNETSLWCRRRIRGCNASK